MKVVKAKCGGLQSSLEEKKVLLIKVERTKIWYLQRLRKRRVRNRRGRKKISCSHVNIFVIGLAVFSSLFPFHHLHVLLCNSNVWWGNQNLPQPRLQVQFRARSVSFMAVLLCLFSDWNQAKKQNKHPLQSFTAIWCNVASAGGTCVTYEILWIFNSDAIVWM